MYKAVIVEDEPWSLMNIKTIFPWQNYNFEQPTGFDSAQDALGFIAQNKPDVLFTDIKMPEMSGLELIKRVREFNTNIKIVVISGHANFTFAQQAINYNIFSYLLKPVNRREAEELIMKLKTALDREHNVSDLSQKYEHISNTAFQKLLKYVDEHFNEKLQLNTLTERFHINESYGSQLFNEYFACGFTEYITNLKMHKAAELLKSDMSVAEIADFLNYDYAYFSKLFKKHFGMTPKQYRQKEGGSY
ncbi:MAG: response regulator [Clostridia bacterium]|nr:response regulator [Clostridia bacterium]